MKVQVFDIGDRVNCDLCNKQWTSGTAGFGGFLFGSKACCPDCAPEFLKSVMKYGEEQFINGQQPADQTFWAWCMTLRGGDNTVKITSFDEHELR